jgi:acylphosphatase
LHGIRLTFVSLAARRSFVSGHVQGVFFRASTRQKAGELGVEGYARNLPDGRVEVLSVGEHAAVESLTAWLHRGPPSARVDAVESLEVDVATLGDMPAGFATR